MYPRSPLSSRQLGLWSPCSRARRSGSFWFKEPPPGHRVTRFPRRGSRKGANSGSSSAWSALSDLWALTQQDKEPKSQVFLDSRGAQISALRRVSISVAPALCLQLIFSRSASHLGGRPGGSLHCEGFCRQESCVVPRRERASFSTQPSSLGPWPAEWLFPGSTQLPSEGCPSFIHLFGISFPFWTSSLLLPLPPPFLCLSLSS